MIKLWAKKKTRLIIIGVVWALILLVNYTFFDDPFATVEAPLLEIHTVVLCNEAGVTIGEFRDDNIFLTRDRVEQLGVCISIETDRRVNFVAILESNSGDRFITSDGGSNLTSGTYRFSWKRASALEVGSYQISLVHFREKIYLLDFIVHDD